MNVLHLAIIAVISYLLGSFPTSIIVGKLFFATDIRKKGSGNAGGANTFRVFGWKAGLLVIAFDIGKAVVATLLVSTLPPFAGMHGTLLGVDGTRLVAGCAAVVGHIWTVFAGFRGGKGVAAAAGMVLALYPLALLIVVLIFLVLIILTGFVSVGSITAAICFPFIVLALPALGAGTFSPVLFWSSVPLALLIVFTHRKNLVRLLHGNENRFENLMVLRRLRNPSSRSPKPDEPENH
ncbi:MAG TPA: glycerol-3-phosphate 1-O-acyltransferase PlsY [Spirochaetia bacterium]|nr:glycerol-3-phosphate 1-O-acyltransferase PlsY [Spirochaetia bacterium]